MTLSISCCIDMLAIRDCDRAGLPSSRSVEETGPEQDDIRSFLHLATGGMLDSVTAVILK